MHHVVRINYYPPRGDNKEGWDNIDIFGWLGYPMQIKVNFLCRDSILAAPIVLDLALFMDLAQRCGMSGIQEWLSFYWKSPKTAPGLYPEHDLFIQLMKLKNTLRHLRGEELITHLGQRVLRLSGAERPPQLCRSRDRVFSALTRERRRQAAGRRAMARSRLVDQHLRVRGARVDAERGEVGEDPAGEGAVDLAGEQAQLLGLRVARARRCRWARRRSGTRSTAPGAGGSTSCG